MHSQYKKIEVYRAQLHKDPRMSITFERVSHQERGGVRHTVSQTNSLYNQFQTALTSLHCFQSKWLYPATLDR